MTTGAIPTFSKGKSKMTRRLLMTAMIAAVMLLGTTRASADLLLSDGGPGDLFTFGDNALAGYSFTVGNQPLKVTGLAILDQQLDGIGQGLFEDHQVGLWDDGGTLLGSVIVPAGTVAPLVNGFRFVDLDSPILLATGKTYVLAATYPTGLGTNEATDLWRRNLSAEMDTIISPFVTYGTGRFGSGFDFPVGTDDVAGIVGPNMEFRAVPEPASLSMLTLGGVGLIGCSLRGRKHRVAQE